MKGLVARLQDHARFDTVTSCSNMSQVCVRVIPTRSTMPEWRLAAFAQCSKSSVMTTSDHHAAAGAGDARPWPCARRSAGSGCRGRVVRRKNLAGA